MTTREFLALPHNTPIYFSLAGEKAVSVTHVDG